MDWLTTRPTGDEVLNAFAIFSLLVFGVVLVASGFYSGRPWAAPFGVQFSRHFVSRAAMMLAWPAAFGIFFLIIRLLQIDPATFGRPIWVVLSWIALIAAVVAIGIAAPKDRAAKKLRQAGHRPSQLSRRPVRRKMS